MKRWTRALIFLGCFALFYLLAFRGFRLIWYGSGASNGWLLNGPLLVMIAGLSSVIIAIIATLNLRSKIWLLLAAPTAVGLLGRIFERTGILLLLSISMLAPVVFVATLILFGVTESQRQKTTTASAKAGQAAKKQNFLMVVAVLVVLFVIIPLGYMLFKRFLPPADVANLRKIEASLHLPAAKKRTEESAGCLPGTTACGKAQILRVYTGSQYDSLVQTVQGRGWQKVIPVAISGPNDPRSIFRGEEIKNQRVIFTGTGNGVSGCVEIEKDISGDTDLFIAGSGDDSHCQYF